MIDGLDRKKCEQRNRVAARRDGVDVAPIRFLAATPSSDEYSQSHKVTLTEGQLPEDPEQALRLINRMLPEGADRLTVEDVYIHYGEAANDNLIGERFMFMGASTLRNIAKGATKGVAFQNSHRNGGMSHPA